MNSYVNDFSTTVQTYYKDLKKYKPLSKDEERNLIIQAKNNNLKARNKILTSNLKFVFDVAKKYKGYGISIDDLIAEGNIGLTKALDKFDIEHEVKFISYAVFWIRQSMQECIKKNNIHDSMEVSEDEELSKPVHQDGIVDKEDERIEKIDVILSNEEDEERRRKNNLQKKIISSLLIKLDKREKIVITEYFGLEGKEKTLEEIGNILNISKERVRQIKEKSLRKLRSEMLLMDNENFLIL